MKGLTMGKKLNPTTIMVMFALMFLFVSSSGIVTDVEAGGAQSGTISVTSASGDKGSTFTVDVVLSSASNVQSIGVDINWDSSKVTYVSYSKGSGIPGDWTWLSPNVGASSARLGGFGTTAINGSATIAKLTFQIKASAPYGTTSIYPSGATDGLSNGSGGTVTIQESVNITSFTANPTTVSQGNKSTLSWSISNATSASISGVGTVSKTSGSVEVSPSVTTTYTLTAQGPNGPKTATAKVTVSKVPLPEIKSFTVDKNTVVKGDKVTFSFSISGANSASIDPGVGKVNKNGGTATAKVTKDTTYTLTAKNAGGSVSKSLSVSVINEPVINWFTSSTTSDSPVYRDKRAYLGWSVLGAEKVVISGVGEVDKEAGTTSVKSSKTKKYTLTATNGAGSSTEDVTVHVTDKPRIRRFEAKPPAILKDQATNFHWSVNGGDSLEITPDVGRVYGSKGSKGHLPTSTKTYTLYARNGDGTSTATVEVPVLNDAPDLEITLEKFSKKRLKITPAAERRVLGRGDVGAPVSLKVKVENVGKGDAGDFKLVLKDNGEKVNETTITGLGRGDSTSVDFEYTPLLAGDNELEIIADPDNWIPEHDKENNCIEGDFEADTVKGVDLVISNVRVEMPDLPGLKNVLKVTFKITNVGNTNSGSFAYNAYIARRTTNITNRDTLIVEGDIKNLSSGDSVEISKTIVLKKIAKKFYFRGFLDINKQISEANEANNNLDQRFEKKKL
jgi:hypothetical protein